MRIHQYFTAGSEPRGREYVESDSTIRLLESFLFFIPCESDAKSSGDVTSFTCAPVSIACAYTSAGPLSLKQNSVFSHITLHRFAPINTLRTHSTLVAERVIAHFVGSRFAVRATCTAAEDTCLFRAVAGREDIYLHPSDQTSFRLFVAPWHPLQIPQCYFREMLPKIMLKRV